LTIAGLKARLESHQATINKSAKKADLIAQLIGLEAHILEGTQSK
jgi:hypothetical protein